jgi:hypothetical protein
MRSSRLSLAALLLILAVPVPGAAQALDLKDGILHYGIWRDGVKVGRSIVTVHHLRDQLIVDKDTDMVLRFALVPVYRFAYGGQEVWQDGRLVELIASTDDNGDGSRLEVEPAADGLAVAGAAGRYRAPADTVPSSLWSIEMTKASRVLDTETGRLLSVRFTEGAEEPISFEGVDVAARHISASGGLTRELWYGPDGLLLRAQYAGPKGAVLDVRFEGRDPLPEWPEPKKKSK